MRPVEIDYRGQEPKGDYIAVPSCVFSDLMWCLGWAGGAGASPKLTERAEVATQRFLLVRFSPVSPSRDDDDENPGADL